MCRGRRYSLSQMSARHAHVTLLLHTSASLYTTGILSRPCKGAPKGWRAVRIHLTLWELLRAVVTHTGSGTIQEHVASWHISDIPSGHTWPSKSAVLLHSWMAPRSEGNRKTNEHTKGRSSHQNLNSSHLKHSRVGSQVGASSMYNSIAECQGLCQSCCITKVQRLCSHGLALHSQCLSAAGALNCPHSMTIERPCKPPHLVYCMGNNAVRRVCRAEHWDTMPLPRRVECKCRAMVMAIT
jgi:hypothetical protein